MKEGWKYKKFEDALEKVKYTKKLQTNEFLSEGRVPIISQEEDYISGFWNNPDDAYKVEKPIVIFGDHSRVIKYVDFDFVLGADGVKILKPIESLNAKFLYHYLKWYDVPNMGYSRHYKFLKEINMPVPPLKEQQQIVSELDLLSEVIEKHKAQLEELDKLAQSIFYDMFGDPVANEKNWDVKPLKENVYEMFLGPFGSSLKVDSYVPEKEAYCMVYEQKHAIQATLHLENHFINKEKYESLKRFEVKPGDFIMSCRGTIGKLFYLPDNAPSGIIHPSLMKIRIKETSYLPKYFSFMLPKIIANETTNGNCVQMAITAKALGNKNIIIPPLSLQQEFAAKVEAIEAMKAKVRQSLKEAETLFNERMDYYFN